MIKEDVAAIQVDDALLDALSGSPPTFPPADEPLANVLLQWRREVDAEPIPELVDTDTAMALVADARGSGASPQPGAGLSLAAAATALLLIAASGVGLAARSAEPGDRLWGVTKVLYPHYAHSVQVRIESDIGRWGVP